MRILNPAGSTRAVRAGDHTAMVAPSVEQARSMPGDHLGAPAATGAAARTTEFRPVLRLGSADLGEPGTAITGLSSICGADGDPVDAGQAFARAVDAPCAALDSLAAVGAGVRG